MATAAPWCLSRVREVLSVLANLHETEHSQQLVPETPTCNTAHHHGTGVSLRASPLRGAGPAWGRCLPDGDGSAGLEIPSHGSLRMRLLLAEVQSL
jgi:hypothetical protein